MQLKFVSVWTINFTPTMWLCTSGATYPYKKTQRRWLTKSKRSAQAADLQVDYVQICEVRLIYSILKFLLLTIGSKVRPSRMHYSKSQQHSKYYERRVTKNRLERIHVLSWQASIGFHPHLRTVNRLNTIYKVIESKTQSTTNYYCYRCYQPIFMGGKLYRRTKVLYILVV